MLRLFFLLIFYSSCHALTLYDTQESYKEFTLGVLLSQKELTLDEIQKAKFTPSKNNFALGYHKGDAWFKVELQNNATEQNFILTTNEFFYEKATLYIQRNNTFQELHNSLFTKIKDREVQSKNIALAFKLPQDYKGTLYLKLSAKFSYFGQIDIYKEKSFYKKSLFNIESFILFMLGVIFTIAVFQLFLYRYLKNIVFLYYTLYVLFLGVYILNITGFFTYLDMQKHLYLLHIASAIALIFLLLFSKEYFQTKHYAPLSHKILNGFVLTIIIMLLNMIFFYAPLNKIFNVVTGLSILFLLFLAVKIYFAGFSKIKYYFLAILLFLVGLVIFVSMLSGIEEYSFYSRYGFIIASFFEVIIFSLLLSDKYNDLHKEKLSIQSQLIQEQKNYQKRLEQEVYERTTEIANNYTKIAKLSDERALLLKELHHRVKNNFQTVISMLWFEEKKTQEQRDFKALINRIKSMSNVHEFIYNTDDLSLIETQQYLTQVIENLKDSYSTQNVQIDYSIEHSLLNINTAISLGVILNELITNSIKHSNVNQTKVEISFNVYPEKKVLLFTDNNKQSNTQTEAQRGMGLAIIEEFSQKISNSSYSLSYKFGTKYVFELYEN